MEIVLVFGVFLLGVAVCMVCDLSLSWALLAGVAFFFFVGLKQGYAMKNLAGMALEGIKTTFKVLRILLLIGVLTALWRAGGTVAFFVRAGVSCITPETFILIAFLLPAIFSMAFGSSFGVAGTAGVILMTIARSGGADLIVTAGAIMSGIYVGERLSPASSAAAMVVAASKADERTFRSRMWKDTLVPFGVTLAIYGVLSVMYPIDHVDAKMVQALDAAFQLTWPVLLPAAALLLLPWLKVSAVGAIVVSCLLSGFCAIQVQGMSLEAVLEACVLGYQSPEPELNGILSGGGLVSMLEIVVIVILSCAYSGMFEGTGLLKPVTEQMRPVVDRIGLVATHIILAFATCMLFCNQTVGTVMSVQLMEEEYRRRGISCDEMAANIGNTVINLAGLVPWAIAASVPLAAMGVGAEALVFSVYLYLLPLYCWGMEVYKKHRVSVMG